MSWGLITDDWRIKLLALGLAVLMLGAVAFSQNPPTTGNLTVGLNYTVPPNIILINPPAKANVTYSGLADVIAKVNPSNLTASVDATHALPGSAVKLNVVAHSLDLRVQVQNPPPIAVLIDTLQVREVPVQVNARAAPGYAIDPTKTLVTCPGAPSPNPCKVHFEGPVSWENNLKAVVTLTNVAGTMNPLNQTIQLQNANGNLDATVRTVPSTTIDVTSVDVHIEAFAGTTSVSVPLVDSPPTHPPPQGYRVTAITVTPMLVTISGDPAVLARIRNIALAGVDLSKNTSDATFQIAIDYQGLGVTGNVPIATVKYSISANPNVSPSP
jgi:YbbR domain-containing protein